MREAVQTEIDQAEGTFDVQRGTGGRNISDHAINRGAVECDGTGFQNTLTRGTFVLHGLSLTDGQL
jgi:hypothetical protein